MLVVEMRFLVGSCYAYVDYLSCLQVGQEHYLDEAVSSKVDKDHSND